MNFGKFSLLLAAIVLLTVSCGPLLPYTEPASTPAPTATITPGTSPVPWPSVHGSWTTFGQRPYISQTIYDPTGYLWVTSAAGVYRFDLETGVRRFEFEFRDFTLFTTVDGLPATVRSIAMFDGKVWVAANMSGQVAYYNGEKWVTMPVMSPPCYVNSLVGTRSRLWLFGCDGIYYYNGEQWGRFDQIPAEYEEEYSSYYSVVESPDGSLWFESYSRVLQFDGTSWKEYEKLGDYRRMLTLADGTRLFVSDAMSISYNGRTFWTAIFDTGRYPIGQSLLTPDGDLRIQIQSPDANFQKDGYPSFLIPADTIERTPGIEFKDPPESSNYLPMLATPFGWVFYDANSIYIYGDGIWETIELAADQTNELVGKAVIGFSPDGAVWVMDGNQPRSFDGREVKSPFEEKPCENSYSDGRITATGSIWAVSANGDICYLNTETGRASEYELYFDVAGWDVTPDNSIWVYSRAGFMANVSIDTLQRGDYREIELIKVGGDSLNYTLVPERIEVDANGAVWVSVKDLGLYRYNGTEWKNFGMPNPTYPYAFSIDAKGAPWVAMRGNLSTHDGEKWIQYAYDCLDPSNMTITPDDVVWLTDSCGGVWRSDMQGRSGFEKEFFFGGATISEIIEAPDGAIWFFTSQRWIRFEE